MIITLQELRDQIGKPTADESEFGNIQDGELQAIIDRYTAIFEELVDQRVHEAMINNVPIVNDDELDEVQITLDSSANTNLNKFAIGDVSPAHYAYTTRMGFDDNYIYSYDANIEKTINLSFVEKRRFTFKDQKIFVSPNDATEITVFLPLRNVVHDSLGADLYGQINNQILAEAERFMDRTIQEGARQETTDFTLGTEN